MPKGGLTLGEIRVLSRELIRECGKCGRMTVNYVSKNESALGWLEFDWRNNAICQDNCIDPAKDLTTSNSSTEEEEEKGTNGGMSTYGQPGGHITCRANLTTRPMALMSNQDLNINLNDLYTLSLNYLVSCQPRVLRLVYLQLLGGSEVVAVLRSELPNLLPVIDSIEYEQKATLEMPRDVTCIFRSVCDSLQAAPCLLRFPRDWVLLVVEFGKVSKGGLLVDVDIVCADVQDNARVLQKNIPPLFILPNMSPQLLKKLFPEWRKANLIQIFVPCPRGLDH